MNGAGALLAANHPDILHLGLTAATEKGEVGRQERLVKRGGEAGRSRQEARDRQVLYGDRSAVPHDDGVDGIDIESRNCLAAVCQQRHVETMRAIVLPRTGFPATQVEA